MILDVNVLLALSWDTHVHHHVAHRKFSTLTSWATTPVTEAGLLRLLLRERVVGRKVSGAEALTQLSAMQSVPGWRFLADSNSLVTPAIDTRVLMGRRQVTDLQLVNLAALNETKLVTFDASLKASLVPEDQRLVEVWSA